MISTPTTIIIEVNPIYDKGHPDLICYKRFLSTKLLLGYQRLFYMDDVSHFRKVYNLNSLTFLAT
jgi:hypothetical protein